MKNVTLPQLIHALDTYMDSTSELKAIRQKVGSADIWALFWVIAKNNKTLYENLYNNIGSFYDESIHEFNFLCEERVYKEANYEMYLKQVLRYIDPITYPISKLEKDSWKVINSINIIKNVLTCLFTEKQLPVKHLYEANRLRVNDVHKGKGSNNLIIQKVIIGMYIATCVAKRAKENQIVAGIKLEFGKCKVLSSNMLPDKAVLVNHATTKRILLPEALFPESGTIISLPIEICQDNSTVYKEQVQVKRGEFKTIKQPKAAPVIKDTPQKTEPPLKKKDLPTKEHILHKWFIRYKRRIKQAALLLLSCLAIMQAISLMTMTPQMETENLQENSFYPSIEGIWVIKSNKNDKSLGFAEITSFNEYGTQGRIATMLYEYGREEYEFTLNRNTGMLNIEGNIQTQVEYINKIVKLQFIFEQWKLEKYN